MPPIIADLGHIWLKELEPTLTRYTLFAGVVWFVLWIILSRAIAPRKIRRTSPPASQLAKEFAFSVRSMIFFAAASVGIALLERAGAYRWEAMAESWGPVWFWTALVITIVVHDAYFYWTHRMMHDPRLFRRLHLRHHRSNNPSPFTAYSFDLGEAGLMVAFFVVWPMIFPMAWGVNSLFMLFQIVRNTFLHSGYELRPAQSDGRPWLDFMTTTTHHDLHHGEAGYNYGAWFTWWDRWMGTEHPEYLARYARAAWKPFQARAVGPEQALTMDRPS